MGVFLKFTDQRCMVVDFVHAAPEERWYKNVEPVVAGSNRQLVDNLARSLDRRVTLCVISEFLPSDDGGKPITLPLAQGLSVCHKIDQFKKVVGRAHALDRALTNLFYLENKEDSDSWEVFIRTFPKEFAYLQEYYDK